MILTQEVAELGPWWAEPAGFLLLFVLPTALLAGAGHVITRWRDRRRR